MNLNGKRRLQSAAVLKLLMVSPFSLLPVVSPSVAAAQSVFGLHSFSRAIAVQSDGKIISAGSTDDSDRHYDVAVSRTNPDGSVDAAFGTHGVVVTDLGSDADSATGVGLQSDGKIVVSARTLQPHLSQGYLIRYLPDGTLDSSFGGSGIVTAGFSGTAYGVAIQQDDKIVVAGYDSPSIGAAIARYSSDGSPDPSFGGSGVVKINTNGDFWGGAQSLALQSDGRILAAGYGNGGIFVLRLDASGSLDPGFGSNGVVNVGYGPLATSLAARNDGKIFIATILRDSGDILIKRLNSDGSTDLYYQTVAWSEYGHLRLALQADGDLLAAGDCVATFEVVRWNEDGLLDSGFAASGIASMDLGIQEPFGLSNAACSIAVQSDGAIVLGGRAESGGNDAFALARFDTSGTPDANFDGDGSLVESDCRRFPLAPSSCLFADKNDFRLQGSGDDGRAWSWKVSGNLTFAKSDSGAPEAGTRYSVCVYDTQAGIPRLTTWLDVYGDPSGWQDRGTHGWAYRGSRYFLFNADGVRSLRLRSGSSVGKSSVKMGAGGWRVPLPIPLSSNAWFDKDPGVLVRLVSSDGFCVESDFSSTDVLVDDGLKFEAKTR